MPPDTLLRSLLKDLQQQAEVDRPGPLKLEEMADSVAGAMQGDLAEGSQESHGRGAEGQLREQADASEALPQGELLLPGSFAAGWPQEREEAMGRGWEKEEGGAWRRGEGMPCRGEGAMGSNIGRW